MAHRQPQTTILDLDNDVLAHVMQCLPVKTVRGRLTRVCKQLSAIASSSAALGSAVDVSWIGTSKSKAVGPMLDALSKLNKDGKITSVKLGKHAWGKTTTKKLAKLFHTNFQKYADQANEEILGAAPKI